MRKCHWCKELYDPKTESSVWCEKNPHRGRGANRRKPRIFTVSVIMVAPNKSVQPTIESGRVLPAKKSNRKGSAPAKSG